MKTAISVPDDVFHRASHRAKALGLSRSEFFTRAARSYLEALDAQSLTKQIDAALEAQAEGDESGVAAVDASRARLLDSNESW